MIPLLPIAALAALTASNAALTTTLAASAAISRSRHSTAAQQRISRIPPDDDNIGDVELPRKYSLAEIDTMRRDTEWSYPSGVSYYAAERAAEVERKLRTYMMAGVEPAELEGKRMEAQERDRRSAEWEREMMVEAARARVAQKAERPPPAEAAPIDASSWTGRP